MADAEVEGWKAEVARLRQENESLRKALYELLHVSFPPVGADIPEVVRAHFAAVKHGCLLLGIDPDGMVKRDQSS